MDVYDSENLVMDMDISFVNDYFITRFTKGIRDTAWVFSSRDKVVDEIVEGETVTAIVREDINEKNVAEVVDYLAAFLDTKRLPVCLKVFINIRKSKFGFCLIQLK